MLLHLPWLSYVEGLGCRYRYFPVGLSERAVGHQDQESILTPLAPVSTGILQNNRRPLAPG